jgi:hypothetical protein
MRVFVLILAFLGFASPSIAQTFDLLAIFGGEWTYLYSRTGIPSTFMGGDTSSQFTEFDGTITMRHNITESPDGTMLVHALSMTRRGLETVRTSRRIVSQHFVTVLSADTVFEFLNGSEGCASSPLRGWIFPDSTWNSPPCPGIPDTLRLYPYGRFYRYYTPTADDSLDVANGVLHLRRLLTDCLDYGIQTEFRVSRSGLEAIHRYEFNFFDWSSDEHWQITVTPRVRDSQRRPENLTLTTFPNPARVNISVRVAAERSGSLKLVLHDLQGRVLDTVQDRILEGTVKHVAFDLRSYGSGTYFCTALTATGAQTVPIVLLRD